MLKNQNNVFIFVKFKLSLFVCLLLVVVIVVVVVVDDVTVLLKKVNSVFMSNSRSRIFAFVRQKCLNLK